MTPELEGRLRDAGLDPQAVENLVRTALAEDGAADVTSEPIFAPGDTASGDLTAREDGVVAGIPVAEVVFDLLEIDHTAKAADGDRVTAGQVLLSVAGPTRAVLRAERTALNLLTHLSGIATETRRWADAIAGTKARVRDTRKTLPGLRALQKYAVRCGGGTNHRMSLADRAMVKDNHVLAAGGVVEAFHAVRERFPDLRVEVEVTDLDQLRKLLDAGCTEILLDNMDDETLADAVRISAGRATLEASGGMTIDRAPSLAGTGVDFVSVGALTHSADVFDIGMDLRSAQ